MARNGTETVTLLVEYLQAVAAGDPRRDAIGVMAVEAALPILLAGLRRVSA